MNTFDVKDVALTDKPKKNVHQTLLACSALLSFFLASLAHIEAA